MMLDIFKNQVLIGALLGWALAQIIKMPVDYLQTKKWDWSLFFQPGGMPSSHSALVVGLAHGVGLTVGFDSPSFAICFALAMVVMYDATGVRREAGLHAELINAMIADLAAGHPLKNEELKEVLGHTPLQVLGGILLGLICAQVVYMLWR
jgi:hypothetical protein